MTHTFVNKNEYGVFNFFDNYYGICKIGTYGGECIFGGDSAWEDCYDLDLIKSVYEQWDGNLIDGKISV